ncbi:bifunctional Short-chain dehydrogenase-reductase SDR/NAD(P)-binding domain superfamily [Babesia duncani]|uniref:Bifunctional Short-chain dehydrogenase-reductase SDR/NAD(P)-binding domain superfamily n=1 Tax=Babesia duncani TaxID=323732 RepID=A0AAD9UND3_9APIC|nr:bifunctional Short-chain dehydrogenase-reductase SDR/NAD(P)-binding domain superfamily [Babesia duncani]
MFEKSVIVTGCDSGLGFALCEYLALKGYHVLAGCKSNQGVTKVSRLFNEILERLNCCNGALINTTRVGSVAILDITSDESVDAFYSWCCLLIDERKIPPLYALDCCTLNKSKAEELRRWQKVLNTNVLGTVRVTLTFLPMLNNSFKHFKRRGRVIFISSVLDTFALAGQSSYIASKHALKGFCDALSHDLYEKNIDVILVSPGALGDTCLFDYDLNDPVFNLNVRRDRIKKSLGILRKFGSSCHLVAKTVVQALETSWPRFEYRNTAGTLLFNILAWVPKGLYKWLVNFILTNLAIYAS